MDMKNERKRTFLLITIPILALFVCFNTIPLIRGVIYSFTNFKGFGTYDWVGLRNYADLFTDGRVGKSYLFTFKLAVVTTVVVNVLSLVLALALNSKIRAKSFFRGAYFLPNILGALVVGYKSYYFFFYILPSFGPIYASHAMCSSVLSNPDSAWIGIMVVCSWQAIAMNTIIYISGLQTVPEDVYEAGGLDGATGWKQFRYLTFPLIIPFFSINMVLCVKNFLMVFDQIMALTKGGPAQSTESISYLIYNNGMSGGQFGFQSANAVIFFLVIVTLSVAIHSVMGYALGRNKGHSKFYSFVYLFIVSGMFVPFAILMMPLAKQTAEMGLANWFGVILLYVVFYMPMNIMLYSGYLVNIPIALEEAAKVDGASTWRTYWKIIFPIMRPMHATVAVLTALAVWNDVMTPLVIMAGSDQNTLPLAQLNFQTQFGTNYNLAFASYLLSLIPILIFYVVCQRQILNGVVNGAVK